jgi:pimeloyl-ACP methyl ester carboxylesterase
MAELDPTGADVQVGGATLRTPGLSGIAEALPPSLDGLRGPAEDSPLLADAIDAEGMEPQELIEIRDAFERPIGVAPTRTAHGEDAIELDVPAPTEGFEQVVLATDEAGVATWHFAAGAVADGVVRGGDSVRTYRIARRVPGADAGVPTRNLTGVAKKLIRVLTFDVGSRTAGWAANAMVDRWESANRPYRLRTFSEADQGEDGVTLEGEKLRAMAGGRALLLVHGTGSTTASGFGNMHPDLIAALRERYEGRVFAFDHPTIATDPDANVRELLRRLPGDGWDLDIIAHSRGGLVARSLVERQDDLRFEVPARIRVERVVFLGVPNAGTPLADTQHLGAYVDTMTTLLNLVARALPVAATLAGIIAIVKQLAAGAVDGLDGLQSMVPGGRYLERLGGSGGGTAYFAMASNFEPVEPGLVSFKDVVLDLIFGAENDLVVPTAGVYDLGRARGAFPIPAHHRFEGSAGVDHSAFVRQQAAIAPILGWLG